MNSHEQYRFNAAIAKLESAAASATPGPWVQGDYGVVESLPNNRTGSMACDHIATFVQGDGIPDNAAYIAAAHPSLILLMVAEIKNLRSVIANGSDGVQLCVGCAERVALVKGGVRRG